MKKMWFYFGLLAVAVLLFACQKETNSEDVTAAPSEEQTTDPAVQDLDPDKYLVAFSARIEQVGTRVSIDVTEGALSFEEGDEVLVVTESGETGIYVYNSDAVFAPKDAENAVSAVAAKAYYPAGEFAVSGSDVTFTLPTAISAGSAEDLGDKLPMAAVVTSNEVAQFKVLGSVLHARFNSAFDDGETISELELTVAGASITGSGTVGWTDDVPSIASLDGTTSMKIGTANGHLTKAEYKDFYFFLPATGTLTSMALKAIYGKTSDYEPYETISRTSAMNLERNKVYLVKKSLSGFFSGGDGTESHPYLIATAADFKAIATLANASTAAEANNHGNGYLAFRSRTFFGSLFVHYKQTADIDFEGGSLTPIGTTATAFNGNYNGYQHVLSDFSIEPGNSLGLWGIAEAATIQNVTVDDATISGGSNVGAIVGTLRGGHVENCNVNRTNKGGVFGTQAAVGGVVGSIRNTAASISNCANGTQVTNTAESGNYATGGIVGYIDAEGSRVEECSNTGIITANNVARVGGIVGMVNKNAAVYKCNNSAEVSGLSYVGGIVGQMSNGVVEACFNKKVSFEIKATGTTAGTNGFAVGGIVGGVTGGTVKTCYSGNNSVKVSGYYQVGGIVGLLTSGSGASLVINCVGQALVSASYNATTGGYGHAGGIVGTINSSTGKNAVLANSVALAAKVWGVFNNANVGAVVGRLNGAKDNSIVHNCYSQANSNAFIGFSTNNGGSVSNGNNSGGVYGYLNFGTVIDCYYTKAETTPGAGSKNASAANYSLKGNGVKEISNYVKNVVSGDNGKAIFSTFGGGYDPGNTKLTLIEALDYGGYASQSSTGVDMTYSSLASTETFSAWTTKNNSSTPQAIPVVIKELGNNYYN